MDGPCRDAARHWAYAAGYRWSARADDSRKKDGALMSNYNQSNNSWMKNNTIVGKVFGSNLKGALPLANIVANYFKPNDPDPPPPPPVVPPPPKMPVFDDEQAQVVRRKSVQDQYSRRGRASTILTDSDKEKLGG
jgi:hypothetical protein